MIKETSLLRWDSKRNKEKCYIYVKRKEDYSEWIVSADNYYVIHTSSGQGYKGKTEKEKIDNLIKEIKKELNSIGYFNIAVKEKVFK